MFSINVAMKLMWIGQSSFTVFADETILFYVPLTFSGIPCGIDISTTKNLIHTIIVVFFLYDDEVMRLSIYPLTAVILWMGRTNFALFIQFRMIGLNWKLNPVNGSRL